MLRVWWVATGGFCAGTVGPVSGLCAWRKMVKWAPPGLEGTEQSGEPWSGQWGGVPGVPGDMSLMRGLVRARY